VNAPAPFACKRERARRKRIKSKEKDFEGEKSFSKHSSPLSEGYQTEKRPSSRVEMMRCFSIGIFTRSRFFIRRARVASLSNSPLEEKGAPTRKELANHMYRMCQKGKVSRVKVIRAVDFRQFFSLLKATVLLFLVWCRA
jgi:hypothetical protein